MSIPVRENPFVRRGAFALLALLVASLPVGNQSVGPLQLVQPVAILAAAAVLVVDIGLMRVRVPPWQVGLPLAGMMLAAALSSVSSPVPDSTFRINAGFIVGSLLVVAMWNALDNLGRMRSLMRLLVLSAVIVAFISLRDLDSLDAAAGGAVVTGRAVGVFSQPNELGLFMAMLLPPTVALAWAKRGPQRVFATLAAAVIFAALLVSLSRGAWLGAILGVAVLALLLRLPLARWAQVVTLGMLLATVAWLFAPPAVVDIVAQRAGSIGGAANPYDERGDIYAEAGRQFLDSPWIGHGAGAFSAIARRLGPDGHDLYAEHAHSLLLVVATEYGAVGVLALGSLGIGLAWLLRRAMWGAPPQGATVVRREEEIMTTGLFAGLVALIGHGVMDYPLRNPVTGMTAWLILALTVGGVRVARLQSQRQSQLHSQLQISELGGKPR